MSFAVHDYVCSRCELRCMAGAVPGPIPLYDLGDGNVVPMRQRAAWCAPCGTFTRAEALPQSDEQVEDEIRAATNGAQLDTDDNPRVQHVAALKARFAASAGPWRQWAAERRGTAEHCMTCGNEVPALVIMEGDVAWPTRFIHPSCGGVVSSVETDLRVDWCAPDFETIAFDRDGRKLGRQCWHLLHC